MPGRLKGKIAFVTAAGQGIGRAIAEAFVGEGAKVVATDLDAAKLKGLKKAATFALDVRSTEAVNAMAKKVIKEFGAPNVLANCAGYVHQGTVLDCSEQDWDFSFDLNVKSMHQHVARLRSGDVEERRRLDHQHRFSRFVRSRPAEPLRLWRQQGRHHRPDQGGCGRFHPQGHPRQRYLPRHDPVALAR